MPFNLFGGSKSKKPPDKKTLALWLCGKSASAVQTWLTSTTMVFLEEIDKDGVVERLGATEKLSSDGVDKAKGELIRRMLGGAPGMKAPRPLTNSEFDVAAQAYDDIRERRYGELSASAMMATLANATMAWYGGLYDHSIAVATHVLDDIDNDNAEAYRVRAFSRISLCQYSEARGDLKRALDALPTLEGARESLAALDALLAS